MILDANEKEMYDSTKLYELIEKELYAHGRDMNSVEAIKFAK